MDEIISFAVVERNQSDESRFDIKSGRYVGTYFRVYSVGEEVMAYWEFENGSRRVSDEDLLVSIDLTSGRISEGLLKKIEDSTKFFSYLSGS